VKKIRQSLDTSTLPFLPNFSWLVFDGPVNVSAKFAVRSFSRSEIIAIAVSGSGCKPQSWGRRGRRGVEGGTVRKSVCDFL